MLKFITEEEYKKLLGKESVPSSFDKLVTEASYYINKYTFGRINPKKVQEEVKYATCLIVECMYTADLDLADIGTLKAQNIEGWSENYLTPEEIKNKLENDKLDILETYLGDVLAEDGNLLLYRGGV